MKITKKKEVITEEIEVEAVYEKQNLDFRRRVRVI